MAVRRRVDAADRPGRELVNFYAELWMPPSAAHDDPWRATRAWERWRAARAEWVARGGTWPGGAEQLSHDEAACMPDEPWCGSFDDHDCRGSDCPRRLL
jgi:hypothetical protein